MNQLQKEKIFEDMLKIIFGDEDAEQIIIAMMPTIDHDIKEAHQIQIIEMLVDKCITFHIDLNEDQG